MVKETVFFQELTQGRESNKKALFCLLFMFLWRYTGRCALPWVPATTGLNGHHLTPLRRLKISATHRTQSMAILGTVVLPCEYASARGGAGKWWQFRVAYRGEYLRAEGVNIGFAETRRKAEKTELLAVCPAPMLMDSQNIMTRFRQWYHASSKHYSKVIWVFIVCT